MTPGRFIGYPFAEGLMVLDCASGEVALVPIQGPPVILRPGVPSEQLLAQAAGFAGPAPSPALPADLPLPGAPRTAPSAATPMVAPARDLSALDREVLASYPYPIARSYSAYLAEEDPRLRCKLLVDTFTNVLKMWALQVASEYLRAENLRDQAVNHTLARDFQRPLISAWNLMLSRCLPVLRAEQVPLFSPELAEAYDALEADCKTPITVSIRYEDDAGAVKQKQSRLPRITALIKYRNSLSHGYNLPRERAAADLATYGPVLSSVLAAARFMTGYPLFHVPSQPGAGGTVLGYRLMGASPPAEPESLPRMAFDPALSPLFLRNERTREVLPLFAFFEVEEAEDGSEMVPGLGKDVFLFEGNTKSTVIYLSGTGGHLEKQSRMRHWRDLLAAKALDVGMLSADSMSLDGLRVAAERITRPAIEKLVESGKYLREVTVRRPDLDERLSDFELGDYRGFVLGGESGIGKTTLMIAHAEERLAAGDVVLVYRGSGLVETDLAGRVLRDLGLRGMHFEDFLQSLDPLFREAGGARMRIVIDAVNEHPDAAGLARSIEGLVRQAGGYRWLRIIASVRSAAYERWPADARFGRSDDARYLRVEELRGATAIRTPVVTLRSVGIEQLATMVEAYRAFRRRDTSDPADPGISMFRPLTAFADLDASGSTCAMMRNPLMMRLILSVFHRRHLPAALSYDQAMSLYLDHVVVQKNDPAGAFPERRAFLRAFVRVLDSSGGAVGAGGEVIERERLYQVPSLQAALRNPQRDSAYVQLLELGVLLEEWDNDRCLVRFGIDRLCEFLLAEHHDKSVESPENVLALAERASAFRSLKGALEIILTRACRDGRFALVTGSLDLCDRACGESPRSAPPRDGAGIVVDVVRDLLEQLARARDPLFGQILARLSDHAGETDVRMAMELFDRLFVHGEVAPARAVAEVAVAEARMLGVAGLLCEGLLRLAAVMDHTGDPAHALEALGEARSLADVAGLGVLGFRIDVREGVIRAMQGALTEALPLFARAYDGLKAAGVPGEAARARREQAILVGKLGDQDAAGTLTAEALALAREAGEPEREVSCLTLLASQATRLGRLETAAALYQEALTIAERDGLSKNIALILDRLGDQDLRTDTTRAEGHYQRSLAIRERIGDRSGIAESLTSLASVASRRGDKPGAESFYRRALEIREAIGEKAGIASALSSLGSLLKDRGDTDAAAALYQRALAIREALGDQGALAGSYNSLAILARQQGNLPDAERYYRQALAIYESQANKKGISLILNNLGIVVGAYGRLSEKEAMYERSLALEEELGDKSGIAVRLGNLSHLRTHRGDLAGAEAYARRSLALRIDLGIRGGIGSSHSSLGAIYAAACDDARAEPEYHAALAINEEIGDAAGIASAKTALANIAMRRLALDEAETLLRDVLAIAERRKSPTLSGATERNLGRLALRRGDTDLALQLAETSLARVDQDKGDIATAHALRGTVHHCAGRLDAAREDLQRHFDLELELGVNLQIAVSAYRLANVLLDLDTHADVAELAARVFAAADAHPRPNHVARASALRLRLTCRDASPASDGTLEQAIDATVRAYEAWAVHPDPDDLPISACLDAAARYRAAGRPDSARELIERARTWRHQAAHHRRADLEMGGAER